MSYRSRVLEALSQLINVAVFNGESDEMLSSRAHRQQWQMEAWLDWWFGKGHCKEAYEWEKLHYNLERFNRGK